MARLNRRRVLVGIGRAAAVVLVLVVTAVVVVAVVSVRVIGPSMRPTLLDGDRVVLSPFHGAGTPSRFELVTLRFSDGGALVLKRVVGLPGDRVRIEVRSEAQSEGGPRVLVQPGGAGPWLRVDNPAWRGQWQRAVPGPEIAVPADGVFVLGDNPDASEDSRTRGPAPRRLLGAPVWLRVYPPARAGRPGGEGVRLTPLEANG